MLQKAKQLIFLKHIITCRIKRKFSATLKKEDNWFVSYCPELGVTSQGKTEKSALTNLKEAIELYLEEDIAQKKPK